MLLCPNMTAATQHRPTGKTINKDCSRAAASLQASGSGG
jgi:hypothetical protein